MSKHKEMMERGEMAKHMAEHDMMSEHTHDAEMAGHKDKEMGSMEMQPDDGNMMSQQMGEHGDKMMSYHD